MAQHVTALRRVETGVNAGGGQPVANLVIVGGHREDHAHVERLALGLLGGDDRLQRVGLDGVHGLAVFHGHMRLHLVPDAVGHGDGVAVQVHDEGGDDVGLGAKADGGAQGLTREHVRAIEFTRDDAIEQHLPVGLGFKGDVQAFVFEVAFFVGDGQRHHVGELDEAELEFLLLWLGRPGGHRHQLQQGRAADAGHQRFQQRTAGLAHDLSLNRETKKRRNGSTLCMSRASTVDAFVNSSRSPPLAT